MIAQAVIDEDMDIEQCIQTVHDEAALLFDAALIRESHIWNLGLKFDPDTCTQTREIFTEPQPGSEHEAGACAHADPEDDHEHEHEIIFWDVFLSSCCWKFDLTSRFCNEAHVSRWFDVAKMYVFFKICFWLQFFSLGVWCELAVESETSKASEEVYSKLEWKWVDGRVRSASRWQNYAQSILGGEANLFSSKMRWKH